MVSAHDRELSRWCWVASVVLWFGCGGCGASGDDPDGGPPDDARPAPCEALNLPNAPVIALAWERMIESHLTPGPAATEIALDYFVAPLAPVDAILLHPDFDPALGHPAQRFEGTCRRSIPASALTDLAEEEVLSARITAVHEGEERSRTGRIILSRGSRSLTVDTRALDEEGDWFFLFEPGSGSTRLVIAPIATPAEASRIEHLPRMAATIALVKTKELTVSATGDVVYSPPGFSASWRERVDAWHGALLTTWEEEGEPIALDPIRTSTLRTIPLGAAHRLDDDEPTVLLHLPHPGTAFEEGLPALEGSLRGPCGRSVELFVTTFTSLVAHGDASEPVELAPGARAVVPLACAEGGTEATLPIAATSLNGRAGLALARLLPEVAE